MFAPASDGFPNVTWRRQNRSIFTNPAAKPAKPNSEASLLFPPLHTLHIPPSQRRLLPRVRRVTMGAPVFPPALHPAATSRRTYTRPDSVSPGPSASPYRSRFSHSRGRPSLSSDRGNRDESVSQDRSSEQGSRVPLFRKREGVAAWESHKESQNHPVGAPIEKPPPPPPVMEFPKDFRLGFHPVAAHFLGHRG